ncbi:MAG TPA: type II secretion system F family protein [Tepidisphaeraceae bacterium]|nr:type II secretion system F family protein [Tepidisphaeraceae bacterium]
MESMYLPIMIAAAVALLVWGVSAAIKGVMAGEKRRLQQRLTSEERGGGGGASSQLPLSITRDSKEATGASAMLVRWQPLDGLHRMVVQAYPNGTVTLFVTIAGFCMFGMFLMLLLATNNMLIAGVAAALGGYFPFLMLGQKRGRRQRTLALQLPESLDFLSRVLQAGHSFSTGIQMMSEELPDPLKSEFRRCYEQHSLGQPLEEALKEMATRIESTDFAFFITAVLIQRQTGGDLSEVLKNISNMIRQRIRLQQHVKAKTAEGRFTGYILVAFPALMFVILSFMNPTYAHNLTGTPMGQKMLAVAFGLQMLGLWAIRKITTVRV